MGLFLIGLSLVIIGALLLSQPGSMQRGVAMAALIAGAACLELSKADRFASAALIILAVGFAYFVNRQPVKLQEEEPEMEMAESDEWE